MAQLNKTPSSLLRNNDNDASKITWYIGEPSPCESKNTCTNNNNNNDNDTNDEDTCYLEPSPISTIYNSYSSPCIIL